MSEFVAIGQAVGTLKGLADLAKSLIGLRDGSAIQAKVSELQTKIIAAQSDALAAQGDQFSLLERVRDLESKVRDMEKWDAEKQTYELKQI